MVGDGGVGVGGLIDGDRDGDDGGVGEGGGGLGLGLGGGPLVSEQPVLVNIAFANCA